MTARRRLGRTHLGRLWAIGVVLWRHGLGLALVKAHLYPAHPIWRRFNDRIPREDNWPTAVKDTLVALGPAFVKAGQILSVRSDALPPELGEALHSLQSDVPPLPFARLRPVIEASVGRSLDAVFASVDPAPLAAASIAQVHRAVLLDGTEVAVKVKRPDIEADFERDLALLSWLARRAERHSARARAYHPVTAVEELVSYTRRELDFRNEADVASRLGAHFARWDDVVIPRIHHADRDMIVMDYVAGFPIDDTAALDAHRVDRPALVRTTIACLLEQILVLGLFHADPHPGNMHVTPDGRLLMLDFGIFGELSADIRHPAGLSLLMLAEGQFELAGRYLLKMSVLEADADARGYLRALAALYRTWRHATVAQYGFARLVYDTVHLGARHGIVYPAEVLLYVKAMTTLEGVCLRVAPALNLASESRPYLEGLEARVQDERGISRALDHALPVWLDLAERLPFDAAAWLDRTLEPPGPAAPGRRAPPPKRRHGPLIATAAGVALLVAHVGPDWRGLSWIGLVVLALGLWRAESSP